jgi:hypothetical protein
MKLVPIQLNKKEYIQTIYSRKEIRDFWEQKGPGRYSSMTRGMDCVVEICEPEEAEFLCALWLRHIYDKPLCTHYNGQTLSLYVGWMLKPQDAIMRTWMLINNVRAGKFKSFPGIPLFDDSENDNTLHIGPSLSA